MNLRNQLSISYLNYINHTGMQTYHRDIEITETWTRRAVLSLIAMAYMDKFAFKY